MTSLTRGNTVRGQHVHECVTKHSLVDFYVYCPIVLAGDCFIHFLCIVCILHGRTSELQEITERNQFVLDKPD